jgi:hypothetical protein
MLFLYKNVLRTYLRKTRSYIERNFGYTFPIPESSSYMPQYNSLELPNNNEDNDSEEELEEQSDNDEDNTEELSDNDEDNTEELSDNDEDNTEELSDNCVRPNKRPKKDPKNVQNKARRIKMVTDGKDPAYSVVKAEVEKKYAYLCCDDYEGYIRMDCHNGGFSQISLQTLSESLRRTYYAYENGASQSPLSARFFPTWRSDKHMKTFKGIVYDPSNTDEDMINALPIAKALALQKRLGGGTLIPEELISYSDWFWNLLSDRIPDKAQRDFLLCQFANMVQNPMAPSKVFTILSGPQGSGKNTILDFMVDQILGPQLARAATDLTKDVFGTHSTALKLKVMVVFNEMSSTDSRPHLERIKDAVTTGTITVNEKYEKPMVYPNISNLFATTNNQYPIPVAGDDRRMAVIEMQTKPPADGYAYWQRIYADMENETCILAVYLRLLQMDISHIKGKFQVYRPQSKLYAEMQATSIELQFKFLSGLILRKEELKADGVICLDVVEEKCSLKRIYDSFQMWVRENGYDNNKKIPNKRVVDNALQGIAADTSSDAVPAVIITRASAGRNATIHFEKLKEYLVRKRMFDELSSGFELPSEK